MFRTHARRYDLRRLHSVNSAAPLPYVAAFLAFAITAFAPQVLNDGDTYLHLTAGSWMLQHRALLSRDIFSFTHFGDYWQTHEWLSEILMASAFQWGGWGGLLVLSASAAAAAAYIIANCLERIAGSLYAAAATILSLSCVAPSLLVRPHLLALPVMAFWSARPWSQRGQKENRRPSRCCPSWRSGQICMQVFRSGSRWRALWGLVLCSAPKRTDSKSRSNGFFFTIASTLMCLLTPYGINGLLFPIRLITLPALSAIGEWQSIGLTEPQPLYPALLGIVYLVALKRVRLSLVRASLLALIALAFLHNRHQMIFGAIAPMLFAEPVATRFPSATIFKMRRASIGAAAGLLALTATRLSAPRRTGTDSQVSPISAIAHVPQSLRAQPVLNDYAFGGYLIFTGIKPFIDSRAELYGEQFLERYLLIIRPDSIALNAAIAQYHIQWAVLSPSNPAAALLGADPRWDRLYADRFAVVYVQRKMS